MPTGHNFLILEEQNNLNQTCNYPRRETTGVSKQLQGKLRNNNAREQNCAVIPAVLPTTPSCEALREMSRRAIFNGAGKLLSLKKYRGAAGP